MGVSHSIITTLHAKYTLENIELILQKGIETGLTYYDHRWGEKYEDAPILNANQAALKAIRAWEEKIEEDSGVFAKIEETYGFLYFRKNDDDHICFDFGTFGSPERKQFREYYYIDFDHYIRMALDMCKDFAILKLETDSF